MLGSKRSHEARAVSKKREPNKASSIEEGRVHSTQLVVYDSG